MYWRFITYDSYYHEYFCRTLQLLILGQNVWYFFIRRWCWPECVTNLVKTFSGTQPKMTHKKRMLALELIVVMYLTSAHLIPGGHRQF